MRPLLLSLMLALATTCCHRTVPATMPRQTVDVRRDSVTGRFMPDVVIASYSDAEAKGRLLEVCDLIGAAVVYDYVNFSMVAVRRPANMPIGDVITTLSKVEGVLNVVEDQMCEIDSSDGAASM
ncbi:MAG: hypothetical protein ACI35Q_02400 [Marinilabiliaceae bacterium]